MLIVIDRLERITNYLNFLRFFYKKQDNPQATEKINEKKSIMIYIEKTVNRNTKIIEIIKNNLEPFPTKIKNYAIKIKNILDKFQLIPYNFSLELKNDGKTISCEKMVGPKSKSEFIIELQSELILLKHIMESTNYHDADEINFLVISEFIDINPALIKDYDIEAIWKQFDKFFKFKIILT